MEFFSRIFYFSKMQITNFQKHRNICTKRKKLFLTDMSISSSIQKELHLTHFDHKQFPLFIHFASLTHDNEIKPVKFLVRHETVLPSQLDD